jgi:hypothetical protein
MNAEPTANSTTASVTPGKVLDEPVNGRPPLDVTVTVAVNTSGAPVLSLHVAVTVTVPDDPLGTVTLPVNAPVPSAVVLPADEPPTANVTVPSAAQPVPEIETEPPAVTVPELTCSEPELGGYSAHAGALTKSATNAAITAVTNNLCNTRPSRGKPHTRLIRGPL